MILPLSYIELSSDSFFTGWCHLVMMINWALRRSFANRFLCDPLSWGCWHDHLCQRYYASICKGRKYQTQHLRSSSSDSFRLLVSQKVSPCKYLLHPFFCNAEKNTLLFWLLNEGHTLSKVNSRCKVWLIQCRTLLQSLKLLLDYFVSSTGPRQKRLFWMAKKQFFNKFRILCPSRNAEQNALNGTWSAKLCSHANNLFAGEDIPAFFYPFHL